LVVELLSIKISKNINDNLSLFISIAFLQRLQASKAILRYLKTELQWDYHYSLVWVVFDQRRSPSDPARFYM
jgi:hypothetical protein